MTDAHTDAALMLDIRLARADFALEIALNLPARGITALCGPSGAGKTTLLRLIAGLESGAQGRIAFAGQCWQDSARAQFVPTHRRPIGYVFQEPRLFPHLTVQQNIDFARRR
ncbi:MAG: ATP-binding cassette domain-containing protein, partial [Rhodocyclaceae bacterium]|nr:ATP-binding cassette domain-containing protein [Rhodocyclaceae bacterium]